MCVRAYVRVCVSLCACVCVCVCVCVCEGEKRAECSGLGAREDLTWGQADHFLLGSTCHFL